MEYYEEDFEQTHDDSAKLKRGRKTYYTFSDMENAINQNDFELVKQLLFKGCKLTGRRHSIITALDIALAQNEINLDIVKYLFYMEQKKINFLNFEKLDFNSENIFDSLLSKKDLTIILKRILSGHTSNTKACCSLIKSGATFPKNHDDKIYFLLQLAARGDFEFFEFFSNQNGYTINDLKSKFITDFLSELIWRKAQDNDADKTILYFLNRGMDANGKLGEPLRAAIKLKNKKIIKLLLKYGANPNVSNTPIDFAKDLGDKTIVNILTNL